MKPATIEANHLTQQRRYPTRIAINIFHYLRTLIPATCNVFPWLFVLLLLSPIYFANERLAKMADEHGAAMLFSHLANQWIGVSFQFALAASLAITALHLALRTMLAQHHLSVSPTLGQRRTQKEHRQ